MRKRLTLKRESLAELTMADLAAVVGAATGEWSCDLSSTLLTPIIGDGPVPTTDDCTTGILN